jgi:hypothetical protein
MEYVKVNFRMNKKVLVNGRPCGSTNLVIEIEAGAHTVSLAAPADFKPAEIEVVLEPNQTSPLNPREITFESL